MALDREPGRRGGDDVGDVGEVMILDVVKADGGEGRVHHAMHRRAADEQPSARREHARDLGERRRQLLGAQVLEDGERDHAVEEAVGKRHRLHVGLHERARMDVETRQPIAQLGRLALEVEPVELVAHGGQGRHQQPRAVADLEQPPIVAVEEAQPGVEARREHLTEQRPIVIGQRIDGVVRHQRARRRKPQLERRLCHRDQYCALNFLNACSVMRARIAPSRKREILVSP